MGYQPRELLLLPNLISLVRVPLALCFALVVDRPEAALLVLLLAGLSDMLDGFVARRLGLATKLGAVVDGVVDKLFILVVAVSLLATARLTLVQVALLGVRDGGELLLVVQNIPKATAAIEAGLHADAWGKATTLLQFGAVLLALFHLPHLTAMAVASSVCGVVAAARYGLRLQRQLHD